jgi:alpha-glucosidase
LTLDASIYTNQTEKALHIYADPELPALLSIPLTGFEFVQISNVHYDIEEKLGSYKVEATALQKSDNFKITKVSSDENGVKLQFEFDFRKEKLTGNILIEQNFQSEDLDLHQISIDIHLPTNLQYNHINFHIPKRYSAIFGGGIQFSNCNLKGQYFPLIVEENGVGRGDKGPTFWANLLGAAGNEHTSYAPLPKFITNDQMHYQCFSPNSNSFWQVDFTNNEFLKFELNHLSDDSKTEASLVIRQRKNKKDVILKNANNTGYPVFEDWMYQYILGIQGGKQKVDSILNRLQAQGIKIGAIWIQDWVGKRQTSIGSRLQWDWHANEEFYPNIEQWIDSLQQKDIRVLGYINPYFVEGGKQAAIGLEKDYFVQTEQEEAYKFKAGGFNAYMIDLNNQDARIWMKEIIQENIIKTGFDGWMCDFGEWFPLEGYSKRNTLQFTHNLFPQEWFLLNRSATVDSQKEFFIFNRSWYNKSNFYPPNMWLGDQMGNFGKNDGLASAINAYNSASLSGFPLVHSDIGGYTAIKLGPIKDLRNDEVLQRWIEMECFTPIWRSHEGLKPHDMSQIYQDKEMMQFFAYFDSIHRSLIPYFKDLNQAIINQELSSFIQHPFLLYPDDENTYDLQYQFFVGDDLLVCPVIEEGAIKVPAYLPAGKWQHFFTKEIYQGGSWQEFDAPIGLPAAFWKVKE